MFILFFMSTVGWFFVLPDTPSDKHFWHTLETPASPAQVWQVWTAVDQWKEWDLGLKDAEMRSPFGLGAKGTIISLEGRRSTFKVVAFQEGQSYTFRTPLFLSSLYVRRYWLVEDGKTWLTHEVWFKGLTASLFAKRFGPKFRQVLPEVVENVSKKAMAL